MIRNIIDIYYANSIDLQKAWDAGIRAIIHKATEGTHFRDPKYKARKAEAQQMGFLWGAFHLTSNVSAQQQLDYFLNVEDGSDGRTLLALDWEESKDHGVMTEQQVREFVQLFYARLGYYPMIYGGHKIRESVANDQKDALLANCPLWYQRYRSTPVGLPNATWPTYTLWQYDNEDQTNGSPHVPGLTGADWNIFEGSQADLTAIWPFRQGAPAVAAPAPVAAAEGATLYRVTASSLNLRSAPALADNIIGSLDRGSVVTGSQKSGDGRWLQVQTPGGRQGWVYFKYLQAVTPTAFAAGTYEWMPIARGEIGVKEAAGAADNPRIVEYLRTTSLDEDEARNDETPWCSGFVNWCVERAGYAGTDSAAAASWLHWGQPTDTPTEGAIAVFRRPGGNHVAFYLGEKDGGIEVLGGNQSDAVNIKVKDRADLRGFRIPA